jgi:hypothetical protein
MPTVKSRHLSKARKSPRYSATTFKVGTARRGADGRTWRVIKASNGVKRWSRVAAATSRKRAAPKRTTSGQRVQRMVAAGLVSRGQVRKENELLSALERLSPAQLRALYKRHGMR